MTAMNSSTIFISFAPTTSRDGVQVTTMTSSNDSADNSMNSPGPPYSAELIILFVMLIVFFVLGVVGNALAFYIYYQKRDKTTSTLFILSLAATDFFTCLIVIPYTLTAEMLKYWLVYDFVCKAYMFCMTFNIPLSAFIMVAVGFDRYFCICHPFLHAMTVKRAKICLVCLTLLACGLGIITSLSFGVYYRSTKEQLVAVTSPMSSSPPVSSSATSSVPLRDDTTLTAMLKAADDDGGENASLGSVYNVMNGSSPGGNGVSTNTIASITAGSSLFDTLSFPSSPFSTTHSPPPSLGAAAITTVNSSADGWGAAEEGEEEGGVENGTVYRRINVTRVVYYGNCVGNQLILSADFTDTYQKVYAATFLFSFIIIAVLYALIYRSILIRRAWKAKRKRMSCYASTVNGPDTVAEETQLTNVNGSATTAAATSDPPPTRVTARTSVALRDRMLYANIKTAAMLFVVTIVFIISFLPSWLIGLGALKMNYILFYIFFLNNVANPFIYAFMNRTFRDDLRQLLKRIKNRLSGW